MAYRTEKLENGFIPNKELREAFEKSDITIAELTKRLGYYRMMKSKYVRKDGTITYTKYMSQDVTKAKRELGLSLHNSNGRMQLRRHMHESKAIKYCEALDLLPVEIGL